MQIKKKTRDLFDCKGKNIALLLFVLKTAYWLHNLHWPEAESYKNLNANNSMFLIRRLL